MTASNPGRVVIAATGSTDPTKTVFTGTLTTPSGEELDIRLWFNTYNNNNQPVYTGTVKPKQ